MQPQISTLPELSPPQAYVRGTITALVVALPAGVLNQVLVAGGDIEAGSPWAILFWILIMFGAAGGGWAVRRLSPGCHLAWAAAAGASAYAVVQAIGVVRRLVTGDPISWLAYPFLALLMATCGMLGAIYAGRMTRRYGDGNDS